VSNVYVRVVPNLRSFLPPVNAFDRDVHIADPSLLEHRREMLALPLRLRIFLPWTRYGPRLSVACVRRRLTLLHIVVVPLFTRKSFFHESPSPSGLRFE
jgi:alpha-N-acetylglucosamine transferase